MNDKAYAVSQCRVWDTAYYTILIDFMEDIDYGTWKKKRDSEKKG